MVPAAGPGDLAVEPLPAEAGTVADRAPPESVGRGAGVRLSPSDSRAARTALARPHGRSRCRWTVPHNPPGRRAGAGAPSRALRRRGVVGVYALCAYTPLMGLGLERRRLNGSLAPSRSRPQAWPAATAPGRASPRATAARRGTRLGQGPGHASRSSPGPRREAPGLRRQRRDAGRPRTPFPAQGRAQEAPGGPERPRRPPEAPGGPATGRRGDGGDRESAQAARRPLARPPGA